VENNETCFWVYLPNKLAVMPCLVKSLRFPVKSQLNQTRNVTSVNLWVKYIFQLQSWLQLTTWEDFILNGYLISMKLLILYL